MQRGRRSATSRPRLLGRVVVGPPHPSPPSQASVSLLVPPWAVKWPWPTGSWGATGHGPYASQQRGSSSTGPCWHAKSYLATTRSDSGASALRCIQQGVALHATARRLETLLGRSSAPAVFLHDFAPQAHCCVRCEQLFCLIQLFVLYSRLEASTAVGENHFVQLWLPRRHHG